MPYKFKDKLTGKRITLIRTVPDLKMAKIIFETVIANRKHLDPWLPWVKYTVRVEDTLKYLFEKEEKLEKGARVDYGIFLDSKYIGNIGVFDIDDKNKSAEIGYWLSYKYTRKGYVVEAVKVLEKELFNKFALNRIQIKCNEKNIASAGVAKKCGYVLEGKLRQDSYSEYYKDFYDTLYFSKLKSEYKKETRK